jgi:acyl dehydratase
MLQLDRASILLDYIGREIGSSRSYLLDQRRIDKFAHITEDAQWIHIDTERARGSVFGTTVAHGYLTLAMVPAILADVLSVDNVDSILNYGLNRVRFPAVVRSGDSIRGIVSVLSAEMHGPDVRVEFSVAISVETSKRPCCVAQPIVLYVTPNP